MKNLVKEHMIELKIIYPDNFIDSLFIEENEWEIYKFTDDTLFYVFFELTQDAIGYAFCVKIRCKKTKYDLDTFFYAKNFSNTVHETWDNCDKNIKDRLLADAIERLGIY